MATWPPITRDDLRSAASDAGFDMVLPVLVRRLIAETGDALTELDMPGGSGTAVGGFDGVVTATGSTAFVPEGRSVWELSVSARSGGVSKADDDYGKRTQGPEGTPADRTTYIEVILAPWIKGRQWAAQRTKEGRWKEVRGYNLDAVHTWLDSTPATTAWLADQLGKAIPGVEAIEAWWDEVWVPSTTPPLVTDLVLAGRQSAADELLRRLTAGEKTITLGGELRPEEAKAFIAATFAANSLDTVPLRARSLFVSNPDSLNQLVKQSRPLVLVITDPALAAGMPMQHPHQVVLLAGPGSEDGIVVPPVSAGGVASNLQAAGLSRDRASSLGQLARRSLLALRRSLAVAPALMTPTWSVSPDVVRRRILLLSAWNGDTEPDRRLIATCVGQTYSEIQETVLTLAAATEMPFLASAGERWHLLSPEDAWTLLRSSLSRDDLEAFRAAAKEVLLERNPRHDLPAQDRWKAGLMGAERSYSDTLRDGLAQGLAILGGDSTSRIVGGRTFSQWASSIVIEIFRDAGADNTYHLWMSLGSLLPRLAEAAPNAFLEAMTSGLTGEAPKHAAMFQDGERGPLGPGESPHLDFLRALESLAWSPDFFDEAVDVLADLAALDPEPEGGWWNRPCRSLVGVFNCVAPFTAAGLDQRIRAIERLHHRRPEVARRLMVDLIPDGNDFYTVHTGPRYRDWHIDRPPIPPNETVAFVNHVVDIILADLDDDPQRFLALIDKIDVLSARHRGSFAQLLEALPDQLADPQSRSNVFDAVRELVARHREHSDMVWALPEDQLGLLENAVAGLSPQDPVLRHAWLFAADWLTLGDVSRSDDFSAYERATNERRSAAVADVVANGLDQVAALASTTDYPGLVGVGLAQHSDSHDADMLAWLESDQVPQRDVAFAYLVERLRVGGRTLRDELLSRTDEVLAQARILRATREPAAAWFKLEELPLEVGVLYWREFTYTGLGAAFEHVLEASRSLTQAGRHAAALDLLSLYAQQADSALAAEVAAEALESLIAGDLDDPELPRLARWDFEKLFALLGRYRHQIGLQRVVHIEWQLFPLLGFDADAPTLHAALAEEPAIFVELVSYVYRRDSGEEETFVDESERERHRAFASRAFQILQTWRRCPGVETDGSLDGDRLTEWVLQVRELLRTNDRLGPGDEQIGRILAFAPNDDDGTSPPLVVRGLLEDVRSQRVESGLQIGILNRRGVTTRDPTEGGGQEWRLAESYKQQAEGSVAWPRTRKLLNQIAELYEADARREDMSAENFRRGL